MASAEPWHGLTPRQPDCLPSDALEIDSSFVYPRHQRSARACDTTCACAAVCQALLGTPA
eukprot:scaffold569_cov408-Prasinococcus_capsulatus_cf.AAC.51